LNTPTDVAIYYTADCAEGATDFATIVANTIQEIDEQLGVGLWQGEPYGACGSIVVVVTAVSKPAAAQIRKHIFDRSTTGGINVVIDGESYIGWLALPQDAAQEATTAAATTELERAVGVVITDEYVPTDEEEDAIFRAEQIELDDCIKKHSQ
jgi:hypothetical protein